MIQRMRGQVSIDVDGIDLTTCTDIQVELIQEQTGTEMLFTGADVMVGPSNVAVTIPKDTAMSLDVSPLRAQIMFTREDGYPDATLPFTVPVRELIKEDGYGD